MSNTQFAFIARSRVPDRARLQASIDALGFELKLHHDFTPFEDAGFLPLTLNGEDGPGFEIFYASASEITSENEDLSNVAGGRDHCISMVWRGSMKDFACVMIVSCALAKDFDAVISYEGEPPQHLAEMLEAARSIVKDAAGEA